MKDVLTDYLWVFLVAMVISLLATPVCGRLARSLGIVDRPVGRKVHKNPTPYLGGLAMLVAWLVAAVLGGMFFLSGPSENTPLIGIIIGCTIATGIGLLDDVIDVKPVIKIGGQLAAAYALIFCGVGLRIGEVLFGPLGLTLPPSVSPAVSAALTVFVVLAVCNSVNLLDGLDGLCSGVIVIMVGALTVLAVAIALCNYDPEVRDPTRMIVCMAILGAILGFIPYNFNPASIFMGDAGSMLLGFVAASLFLLLAENTNVRYFYAAIIVFGLPAMDTALAIFRRVRAGKSPASPDAHHLHHQLIRQGLTVRQAVAMLYVLAAVFALAGLMVVLVRLRYGFILAVFVFGIMMLVTTSFQLHRMGPSDRISDETIRQLPRERSSEESNAEAGDSERDEGEASSG